MMVDSERLPALVAWQRRPFPDANLLRLRGRQPALVDSGFVGHAQETAAWIRAHTGHVTLVVRVLLPAHGPIPADPAAAFATPLGRAQRLVRGGRLHAAAEHTPVAAGSLRVPFPRAWPSAAPTRARAAEPQ